MSLAAPSILRVENLAVHFFKRTAFASRPPDVRAVDGVSFEIARGRTLGLVGESGSGKTTVARSVLRLIEPTAGAIHFDGVNLCAVTRREMKQLRRRMQMVFQDPAGSLNPRMTVGQIVAEPLIIHKVGDSNLRRARVERLLEQVGLAPEFSSRYCHELSGGQKQRVGIARALALEPQFLVLDEPVSALDVSVQAQIINLLTHLKEALGLTYLVIAHNLAIVRRICDHVAVMNRGKIVEMADVDRIFSAPQHPYTRMLLEAIPRIPC